MINKHMPVVSMEAGVTASNNDGTDISSHEVEYKDVSVVYRNPIPSYAERVLLTYNEDDAHLIKVLLRQTRCSPIFIKKEKAFSLFSLVFHDFIFSTLLWIWKLGQCLLQKT